jgi:tRNA G10  N-methylase Trm11
VSALERKTVITNGSANKILPKDRAVHEWYRFVLSFPPHLVREYLDRFGVGPDALVLDPFCGTGTVLVECKKLGIPSVGIEANWMAALASRVKTDWTPEPDRLLRHGCDVGLRAETVLRAEGIEDDPVFGMESTPTSLRGLPADQERLLLGNSISPLPLHKALVLLDEIARDAVYPEHERLALAKTLVGGASNLHFGPEVGVGPAKSDAPVVGPWLDSVAAMSRDLTGLGSSAYTAAEVHCADSREAHILLQPGSVSAVITSPPYPNEKDYTRTTRLESVVLGLVVDKPQMRRLKRGLVRSNTRGVYKEDVDDVWVADNVEVQGLAERIEARRIELGKTSGFERMYARVTKLYFGGMARHLASLRATLRPGARLAYVVGDQASYLGVMIQTGRILGDIAVALGYRLESIDLFRTRLATATRSQLREEVVVLRWPGG